jgi:hypothetical protein
MIRSIRSDFRSLALVSIFAAAAASAPSLAQDAVPAKPKTGPAPHSAAVSSKTTPAKVTPVKTNADKTAPAKSGAKPDPKKAIAEKPAEHQGNAPAAKPSLVATYGDWGAYAAKNGATRTCYALAQPKDRTPGDVKRDPAYIFIADRPAENVRNEVSIIMGFDVRGGDAAKPAAGKAAGPEPSVEVGPAKFVLVAKGSNLWLANAAEEGPMIAAMRKTGKLVVRAPSLKGNVTTDEYSLSGLAQALDRIQKECQS